MRMAKQHDIAITRALGATGVYVTPPNEISGLDPWSSDHLAPNWVEASRRVEAYAALLAAAAPGVSQ